MGCENVNDSEFIDLIFLIRNYEEYSQILFINFSKLSKQNLKYNLFNWNRSYLLINWEQKLSA